MRGRHENEHSKHGHQHSHHGRHKRADGGGIMKAGGNPEVEKEAEEKKHGGKVHHERHKRKRGGHVDGHHSKHRLDRAGRKKGGRVGADHAPLSSAHTVTGIGKQPATQEGGASD